MTFRLLFAPVLAALIAGTVCLFVGPILSPWRPASITAPAWETNFGIGGMLLGCIIANRWVRRAKNRLLK